MKIIKSNYLIIKQLWNNELVLLKERQIFKNIYNKRPNKVDELSKKKLIMVTWNSLLIEVF